jgi:hypothetical protein
MGINNHIKGFKKIKIIKHNVRIKKNVGMWPTQTLALAIKPLA